MFPPRLSLDDKPENYFEMTYKLTKKGSSTELEIIQEDNRSGAKQEAQQGEENPVLKILKELVENKNSI